MAFFEYMGPRPSSGHSLDRIDSSRGYEPGNVRWATAVEQNSNKRDNVVIEFEGRAQILQRWADDLGIHASTLADRISRGWPLEIALKKPPRPMGPKGGGRVKKPRCSASADAKKEDVR